MTRETPSQTAGPYVHIGCVPNATDITTVYPDDLGHRMIGPATKGTPITVTGTVFDGAGDPLLDALIEVWQADADGRFDNPDFTGWGRTLGDMDTGVFRFETIRPGPVDGQAPHLTFWIVARGINTGLHTRMYFPDADNSTDPVLSLIDDPARAATLIARADGPGSYHFDIHLQGARETVFFDA